MCGITGFVGTNGEDFGRGAEILARMCGVIDHRGPDDRGAFVEAGVALGMTRLSIIDVGGGHQPMSSTDGAVTIVFNGEIYNFRELRAELETYGEAFRTDSDTEVILRAYERFGVDCLERLRGMFAIAIWDARRRALFVARDRVGEKPLYYTVTRDGDFVFGSEVKSLLEHPGVSRAVNLAAVDAYLTLGYVPDPLTSFEEIRKLPPGYSLQLADGELTLTRYWNFEFDEDESRTEADVEEELRALLDESVRMRLVSDVPLGAFLSGGVDSSAVVGYMARNADRAIKTFSIGFAESDYNELAYARVAAKRFGCDHHEFVVTPRVCDVVDKLVWHFDEPFADSSAIPTYMVSKLAREHVTVVLTGDGGDEVFAGYTRYATDRRRSLVGRLPGAVRRSVLRPLSVRLPHGARGRNYLHNISLDPTDRYVDSVSVFSGLLKRSLYTEAFRTKVADPNAGFLERELDVDGRGLGELNRLLYLDSKSYLPGDILVKVDRMSMAASLESRAPLLDHKLIEAAGRIPASLKMKGYATKHVFKRAVREIVPPEILDRPKQGFAIPLREWINGELRDRIRETITSAEARQRGVIEPAYVNVLLREHETGRRDHSGRLWALFMLESWWRRFADGSAHDASSVVYAAAGQAV